MNDHDQNQQNFLAGTNLPSSESATPTNSNFQETNGLQSVIKLDSFRKLWIGQIFSQLADKFYIILMVYLIAQYWVTSPSINNGTLADFAAAIQFDLRTRAQIITLLATGIYIANTVPAMFLGAFAGVWADRWPKLLVMVGSNGLRALLVLFAPICVIPGPIFMGLSWGYWALIAMTLLE